MVIVLVKVPSFLSGMLAGRPVAVTPATQQEQSGSSQSVKPSRSSSTLLLHTSGGQEPSVISRHQEFNVPTVPPSVSVIVKVQVPFIASPTKSDKLPKGW